MTTTTAPQLAYVVDVEDQLTQPLAGHHGASYKSPPQQHHEALALVQLLLGCPGHAPTGQGPWHKAIAGGRRTIAISAVDQLFT